MASMDQDIKQMRQDLDWLIDRNMPITELLLNSKIADYIGFIDLKIAPRFLANREGLCLLLNDERIEAHRYLMKERRPYTDEEIYNRVSTAPIHKRLIKYYLDIGLDFYEVRGVKLEGIEDMHIIEDLTESNISTQIQIDTNKNVLHPRDSITVQQLRQILSKILIATQTLLRQENT